MVRTSPHITNPCGDQYNLYVDLPMIEVINLDNQLADAFNNGSHINKTWSVKAITYTTSTPYTAVFTFSDLETATWIKMVM